jgi:NAD(P)H-dependent flavin oxidoreductase YrpB (nitropropane dioxygenase family)
MKTPLTELLGIAHPIVLPGMSWISRPELVALSVAEAEAVLRELAGR